MNLGAGRTTAAEIPLLPPKDRNDNRRRHVDTTSTGTWQLYSETFPLGEFGSERNEERN